MSDKLVRIKNRYDTCENWYKENPILAAGEIGYCVSSNGIKVGNGKNGWNDLGYVSERKIIINNGSVIYNDIVDDPNTCNDIYMYKSFISDDPDNSVLVDEDNSLISWAKIGVYSVPEEMVDKLNNVKYLGYAYGTVGTRTMNFGVQSGDINYIKFEVPGYSTAILKPPSDTSINYTKMTSLTDAMKVIIFMYLLDVGVLKHMDVLFRKNIKIIQL